MAYGGSFQVNLSEESFDFICTTCDKNYNKTVEAVRYCTECSGYCCQTCTDGHKLFPTLRNHNLLDVSQGGQTGNQQPRLPEFPTERCSLHKGKIVDTYCKEHDDVFCSTCIATSHKLCPENSIIFIPDKIETLSKLDGNKRINRHLTDMMVSMETISNSKDRNLEALKVAKQKALETVDIFVKALKSIIKKAAKKSKSEIVATYQELKNDILHDKHIVDTANDELQRSERKLKKAEGNGGQRFVCTKQAEKKLKEANKLKAKQDARENQDITFSFIQNQSLMNQIKGLHGIGQVNVSRKKVDMYRIKGNRDIPINIPSDSNTCNSHGCCLTQDNKIIVADSSNKKLKRFNLDTMTIVDYCKLDDFLCDVCYINDEEVAVLYYNHDMIQFVSIRQKMSPSKQIKFPHLCYGVTSKDDKLYVTDNGSTLYVYNLAGTFLNAITTDSAGTRLFARNRHITLNENGDKMFVGDFDKGLVCFDGAGNYLSTYSDSDLNAAVGVCVDGYGNIFGVGYTSHNVVQYNEDGKKIGVIVQQQGGLLNPRSVCYDKELSRLFVTMNNSNVVKMYELE